MRSREFVEESTAPGEYVYHAAHLPDLPRGLASVLKQGLRPSQGGYMGPGVYFAYEPEGGFYHVSAEEATMFRVRWQDLAERFGVYPQDPNGIERDDEQILVPGTVPAAMLEVEYFPDEWWSLEDALAAERGPLMEGRAHPVIVVDVQPEYHNEVNEKIIEFVNRQTGPVLMFVNAEDQGLSGDTVQSIREYWDNTICPEEDRYTYDEESGDYTENPDCPTINWGRFVIVDKGYGYFRAWMDQGVSPAVIIRLIRTLYQQRLNDSRDLDVESLRKLVGEDEWQYWMEDDPFSVNWTSVAQLRRFNGAYIVGGGREECLREVELLMNAFNISYRRIDSLVYG